MADNKLTDNPDYPLELSDSNLDEAVSKYPFLVVDCWAPWCGPCKMLGPVIESLAKKQQGKVVFAKLNVDDNQQTAARFGIRSIPNLIVFKNGQKVGDIVGAMPEDKLLGKIEEF